MQRSRNNNTVGAAGSILTVDLSEEMDSFDSLSLRARNCLRYATQQYSAKQFASLAILRGEENIIAAVPIWCGDNRKKT